MGQQDAGGERTTGTIPVVNAQGASTLEEVSN